MRGVFCFNDRGLIFFFSFKGEPYTTGYTGTAENDVLPALSRSDIGEALLQLLL